VTELVSSILMIILMLNVWNEQRILAVVNRVKKLG